MTIAQIKALFQTGKIPTQADFENLISKIPNDDLTWRGDNTLNLYNPSAPHVNGYRFINNRDANTYLIISCWDNDLSDNVPVLLFYFPTDSPSTNSDTITYHVLTSTEVMDMYQKLNGTFNEASDDQVVAAINYLALDWFKIFNRYNNNPPAPRVIHNGVSTYFVYPCKQNNEWYVGYVVEDEVDMGGSNQLYRLTPVGNSQLKWNISDGAIITDLGNHSKWTRKIM